MQLLHFSTFAGMAAAVNLYVASYNGNLTSLQLTENPPKSSLPTNGSYSLHQTSTFNTSTNSPSWLTLNKQNNVLYLVDETVNGAANGTLVSYRTSYTGKLTELHRQITPVGGVYATFFDNGNSLAVPHYTGSALYTYDVSANGDIKPDQGFAFSAPVGPVANRQDAPHPHETILDPTGQYVLVPDLGADLVRVFYVNPSTGKLTARDSLKAKAGSGPRHGAFSLDTINGNYYFYLAEEIAASVVSYKVTYLPNGGGLKFDQIDTDSTLAPGQTPPPTTTGESTGVSAEITISPDGKYVIISNRRDVSFPTYNPPSDALSVFSISPKDGSLTFLQLFPAGGSYPRQFALNKAGTLAAVGLQQSSLVVILERNTETGKFETEVARASVAGQITCVVWDE